MTNNITITRMTRGDIPFGMVLKDLAGWNQLPLDWERFLEFEPEGCFLAHCDGKPAGTAITIAYEKLFSWVGMVLVHPDMRRKGLGTSLLMAGIEYLEGTGVAAVKLDATPMGKQLYDTIGFVDEYLLERWVGKGNGRQVPSGLTELTLDHLPALSAFDRPIFGADRSRVLRRMLAEPTTRAVGSFDEAGNLQGCAAVRPGRNAMYLGPWIALNAEVGQRLWDWGLAMVGGAPVYVDVLLPNPNVLPMVQEAGFEKQRHLIRMYRGENVSPGRPELQYGIFGPEVG
jgi:GNAT superfamily N-acetyltransferase